MSVTPSTRQKRLGAQAYAAFQAGRVVYITEFWTGQPKQVVRMMMGNWGTVFYSFTEKGWSGMQHVDTVRIV